MSIRTLKPESEATLEHKDLITKPHTVRRGVASKKNLLRLLPSTLGVSPQIFKLIDFHLDRKYGTEGTESRKRFDDESRTWYEEQINGLLS